MIEKSTHFAFLTGFEYFFLIDLITLEFNQESVELILRVSQLEKIFDCTLRDETTVSLHC